MCMLCLIRHAPAFGIPFTSQAERWTESGWGVWSILQQFQSDIPNTEQIYKLGRLLWWYGSTAHSSRVPGLIVSSCYCLHGVLHIFPMSTTESTGTIPSKSPTKKSISWNDRHTNILQCLGGSQQLGRSCHRQKHLHINKTSAIPQKKSSCFIRSRKATRSNNQPYLPLIPVQTVAEHSNLKNI